MGTLPTPPPRRSELGLRARDLLFLSWILLLCFLFYGFIVPRTPGRVSRPSAALTSELGLWSRITELPLPVPQSPAGVAASLLGAGVLTFTVYGCALFATRKRRPDRTTLAAVMIPGMLFLAFSTLHLPNFNTDIFNYIMRGRVAAVYGCNPYIVAADQFPDDPIYPYASHRFTSEPNGKLPSWEMLNQLFARLAGNDPVHNLLFYRAMFCLMNMANVLLIFAILRRLAPERLLFGLVCYAWNPIVVLSGQSKADTVMLMYLLLGVLLLVYARPRLAIVPLTLSVFVKLLTLPVLAIDWLQTLSRDRRRALQYIFVVASVVLVLYLPYGHGIQIVGHHLGLVGSATMYDPDAGHGSFLRTIVFGLLVLVAGLIGNETPQSRLDRWGLLLLTGPFLFWPLDLSWYMIMPVAVLALGTDWRPAAAGGVLCFGALSLDQWRSAFTPEFPSPSIHATTGMWPYWIALGLAFVLILHGTRTLLAARAKQEPLP